MPPKADPYNTPVHRRIDAVLIILAIAVLALLLGTSAHAQTPERVLVTYFNFNDNNTTSDPPGLQISTIVNNNPTRLTTSFTTGTTLNQAFGDLTGAGSALRVTATANGSKTISFTVSTVGLTDLSLSFATRGNLSPYTISYTTSGGANGTIGTVTLASTTNFQLVNFANLDPALNNQTSVTFTITFPNGNGNFADFDNIQLTGAVPEPSTVGAAALSVLGLGWHQRRRLGKARQLLSFSRKRSPA